MDDKPFDLDALAAEAAGRPFCFTYDGRDWEIPRLEDLDKRLLDRLIDEPEAFTREAFRMAFGERWEEFDALPMTLRTLNSLLEAWSAASGIDLGEGVASASSSASTGRPSKPTSPASTASRSRTGRRAG